MMIGMISTFRNAINQRLFVPMCRDRMVLKNSGQPSQNEQQENVSPRETLSFKNRINCKFHQFFLLSTPKMSQPAWEAQCTAHCLVVIFR
jgi:hypothetical protein